MTTAFEYHAATCHDRSRPSGRRVNWADQPIPFKLYRDAATFHLPQQLSLPDMPLDKAMESRPLNPKTNMPTLLAGVCNLAAGLTRVRRQADGLVFHYRTVPSAGALYPTELYFAIQNVNGMNDGLYHFCPLEHTTTLIREGQVFSALAGADPIIRFYLTSVFHRSAWKYGPRAYRYCLLDAGHMVENLLLASRMHGLTAVVDYDFDDDFINDFLCIDTAFEGCLAQVHAFGCGPDKAVYDTASPTVDGLSRYSRSAKRADAPQELLDIHRLSAAPLTGSLPVVEPPRADANILPDFELPASASSTIHKRKSSRNFVAKNVHPGLLSDVLGWLCHDAINDPRGGAVQTGFLTANHAQLVAGYHHLDPRVRSSSLMQPGDFMRHSAHVCLDQGWLEKAALHLVFTADIQSLESQAGPRAYRYAHIQAGRLGQRAYLAATANNLGACGIGAFFDYEAQEMLALPEGNHLLYLVAVGPVKK